MENTTNYSLRKYQSGDLFNPLTVNNPNLDDIDTDMKAISDRAIGRATELVSQGVHAITLLDTDCKTFKFVATGNYSAGETFTVNGIQCNAYTPSGSALVSNAFVTGSIVIGSLNEDGTAITFYVNGSAVADDSLKLGGELPSYYATQTDMTDAETDITNLKNQNGNTSIVGIGDGTLSGAVSQLNNDLTDIHNYSSEEKLIGKWFNEDLYCKSFQSDSSSSSGIVLDNTLNSSNAKLIKVNQTYKLANNRWTSNFDFFTNGTEYSVNVNLTNANLNIGQTNNIIYGYRVIVFYTKITTP